MQYLVGLVHSFERKLLPAILCNKLVQSTNENLGCGGLKLGQRCVSLLRVGLMFGDGFDGRLLLCV